MDDFIDNLIRNLGNTVTRQIGGAATGATGDILDWALGLLGIDGGIDDTGVSSEATEYSQELLDIIKNYPLQNIPYDPIDAVTYTPVFAGDAPTWEANTIDDMDAITAMLTQDSPEFRARQQDAINNLQTVVNEGMTAADKSVFDRVRAMQAQEAAASDQAIVDDLSQRGQVGGMQEVFARQLGRQGAADDANASAVQMAQSIQDRRDNAMSNLANLSSQARGQDIQVSESRADQTNQMAQFNQNNLLKTNLANQDALNTAARDNTYNQIRTILSDQSAANTAGQWNAGAQNAMNMDNRDAMQRAINNMNQDELARLGYMMSGYKNVQNQLNAEEAAAARKAYAEQLMESMGTGGLLPGTGDGSGDGGGPILDDWFGLDPNGGGIWDWMQPADGGNGILDDWFGMDPNGGGIWDWMQPADGGNGILDDWFGLDPNGGGIIGSIGDGIGYVADGIGDFIGGLFDW